MRGRTGAFLRVGIGLAISIFSIWFVLRDVDLGDAWTIIQTASPAWLVLGLLFLSADILFRAVRWQRLILPIQRVRFLPILGYLLVGYLANNVLPARLGELVRSHYLGDRERISRASTLGTVVVERVVDIVVLVAIAAVAILVLNVRGVVASAILVALAVTGLLVVALAIGIAAHRLPGAARMAGLLERWPSAAGAARKLRDGLAVAGRPRTLGEALVLSVAAWGSTVIAFAAIGQAIGLHLLIGEASLLAAGVALATAIPSGPGYLGTYELAAVKIAEALGRSSEQAFALALLAHATVLVLTSVAGAAAFLRLGWTSSVHEVEDVVSGAPDPDLPAAALDRRPSRPRLARAREHRSWPGPARARRPGAARPRAPAPRGETLTNSAPSGRMARIGRSAACAADLAHRPRTNSTGQGCNSSRTGPRPTIARLQTESGRSPTRCSASAAGRTLREWTAGAKRVLACNKTPIPTGSEVARGSCGAEFIPP